jgi:D-arginine dehydrogenase
MQEVDILIIGGGIAGASLAARVGARARTLLIEAEAHPAMHATGRSAAFWLAPYGGPQVMPLTLASRAELEANGELRARGALTIERNEGRDLGPLAGPDDSPDLERRLDGVKPGWSLAQWDPSCADIDVAGLHSRYLGQFRADGGTLMVSRPLKGARREAGAWQVEAGGVSIRARVIVNAAGAWADEVARLCGVPPIGLQPMRRTMIQLRLARRGLRDLPLVIDRDGGFYFKGEGDTRLWLSPHDENPTVACDAAAEEIDVARAIAAFQSVVDWPIEAVERRWAGLRTFTPSRLPVYGFDPLAEDFFWCAGQGGWGIQTAPAASILAADLLLGSSDGTVDPSPFEVQRL